MNKLAVVSAQQLQDLLDHAYSMRGEIAYEGGCASSWDSDWKYLQLDDILVTLAVQGGVKIPGPLAEGVVPPVPPSYPFDVGKVFELISANDAFCC